MIQQITLHSKIQSSSRNSDNNNTTYTLNTYNNNIAIQKDVYDNIN